MDIEPIREWNHHTQRPVTLLIHVTSDQKCLRCNCDFKHRDNAYWIHSTKDNGYVVCVKCFNENEKQNHFVSGFRFSKQTSKQAVVININEPI